jgi:uncharacterized protein (TIGR03083 family)
MSDELSALHESVAHLRTLTSGFGPERVRASAYPTEWTVADTLSHIGSGAVITARGVEVATGQRPSDPDFSQTVWDEWNAKDPDAQAADALAADQALLDIVDTLDAGQQEAFHVDVGPFSLDFAGYLALRLNEHVLHTWDIEVVGDPAAVLSPEASAVILERLGVIVGFAGQPIGTEQTLHVTTTGPERGVVVALGADSVQMSLSAPVDHPDLVLPAESLVRLVYGRLDPDHAPAPRGSRPGVLGQLREAFPGF